MTISKKKHMKICTALFLVWVMAVGLLPLNTSIVKAETMPSNPRISKGVTTWDCIYFGSYYQSNSTTKEKIQWRVLSVDGDTAFLMADKALDCQPYNETWNNLTWEDCSLRTWLNTTFFEAAFNEAEQDAILTTTVVNENNTYYETRGGSKTSDKVFLLSLNEARNMKYGFNSEYEAETATRQCKVTGYAKEMGCSTSDSSSYAGNCRWWLRTPGAESYDGSCVDDMGWGIRVGDYVTRAHNGVRPVLNIKLSASVWSAAGTVSANLVPPVKSSGSNSNSKNNTNKKTQKITTVKMKSYKQKKLSKKKVTIDLKAKTTGNGKLSYKVTSYPKKMKKFISVSKKGKVTLKKKAKKGTYKVRITASATSAYNKATKTVSIKVK